MRKTLARVVLVALAVGMVGKTVAVLLAGSCGIADAVELGVCWAVALGVAVVTGWKAIGGTLVRTEYVYEDREDDDDSEDSEEETEEETPEEEPEETPEPEEETPEEPNETSNT
jgi:hypothetical protein